MRFPGQYTLRNRGERLTDLIERAGGITPEGDASGTYFTRRLAETGVVAARTRAGATVNADSGKRGVGAQAAIGDSARLERGGSRIRVGVDVADALRRRESPDNLYLEEGDSLFVPARQQTVTVRGEVNAPTALVASGRGLGSYIGAAGGATELGRTSRVYVIQPNGKIESRRKLFWLVTLDPTPKPGATVVVPAKGERTPGSALQTIAVVTQTLTALVTVLVLFK